MTVNVAFLCPAVCVSDVINKVGMCRRCIKYVLNEPTCLIYLHFIGRE